MKAKNVKVGKIVETVDDKKYLITKKTNYNGENYYLCFPVDKDRRIAKEGTWGIIETSMNNKPQIHEIWRDPENPSNLLYKLAATDEALSTQRSLEIRRRLGGALVTGGAMSVLFGIATHFLPVLGQVMNPIYVGLISATAEFVVETEKKKSFTR